MLYLTTSLNDADVFDMQTEGPQGGGNRSDQF